MKDFSGRWFTTFGPMDLKQQGDQVEGTYSYNGPPCHIHGSVVGDRFTFQYEEPTQRGEGWFDLARPGKFAGQWRTEHGERWATWVGTSGFEGVWESTFGRLRLVQEEGHVRGFYEGAGSSTLEGKLEGNRLVFRYQEPRAAGEGVFELSEDGQFFEGQWRPDGNPPWGTWTGKRIRPAPGLTWLVVLEAHWQRSLSDNEYSFGSMLKEYFARLPHVAVRHRFFDDAPGLTRWCRELLYCPEPAVVMVASHGTPEGLTVGGQVIPADVIADTFALADNLQLLHFSACLTMQEGAEGAFVKELHARLPFPISGYTTSVDWGGSALIEFTYLDLILSKQMTPEQAAHTMTRLIAFAGDEAPPESPYGAAGFRFYAPANTGTPGPDKWVVV